jgi:hypothetical protein
VTYNSLNAVVPDTYTGGAKLTRNALIGFCASFVSDCVSNSIRVITTAKQTSAVTVGYLSVANGSACHSPRPCRTPRYSEFMQQLHAAYEPQQLVHETQQTRLNLARPCLATH